MNGDIDQCETTAAAISAWIAADLEAIRFKPFYIAAGTIAGLTFLCSFGYAWCKLGGDDSLFATFTFASFVTFRMFDLMSDWGMYAVSLGSEHKGTALRHASMVFSIIGSILLIVDLKTMVRRAEHWFGKTDNSESLRTVGYSMLAVVFLEDIPQLVIAIVFLQEATGTRGRIDPIAVMSVVFSFISMLCNGFVGCKSLRG